MPVTPCIALCSSSTRSTKPTVSKMPAAEDKGMARRRQVHRPSPPWGQRGGQCQYWGLPQRRGQSLIPDQSHGHFQRGVQSQNRGQGGSQRRDAFPRAKRVTPGVPSFSGRGWRAARA